MPTGRRHHNTTTAQSRKRRSKPSDHPSARIRKAARISRARRLLDGEEEEEEEEEKEEKEAAAAVEAGNDNEDDGDDSDVDLGPMSQPVSRPKRKLVTIVQYTVEEQSNDSADSKFELDTDSIGTRTKQQCSYDCYETSEGQRPKISMRGKAKQLPYTEPHVQEKKKGRTPRSNDVEHNLVDPLSKPPPPLEFTNVSHYSTKYKPRHVEEIRKDRSHHLPRHSTSSALEAPPSNPYKSQAAYAIISGSSNTYHDLYALEQDTLLSYPDTSLPDDESGHGIYLPQYIYAPRGIADFEHATLVHSRAFVYITDS